MVLLYIVQCTNMLWRSKKLYKKFAQSMFRFYRGLTSLLMARRLSVAMASVWPPERKKIPGDKRASIFIATSLEEPPYLLPLPEKNLLGAVAWGEL
jgi:hypothetical protein